MPIQSYPLQRVPGFSKLLLDYLAGKPELKPLYGATPTLESFRAQIDQKKSVNRKLLAEVLADQYQGITDAPDIACLGNENTFTVTTGHQLNLLTGPLYVIYKLVSTINLARKLQQAYPEFKFVPVYWMATEDHDWDEINHLHLFGKTYTCTSAQTGAVGRFHTEDLAEMLGQLPSGIPLFKDAYQSSQTLTEAVRKYIHALFGETGLVCIDADDARLKGLMNMVMEADVLQRAHQKSVADTDEKLVSLGYKPQIHAREINFFYMKGDLRERIEYSNGNYHVLNTDIRFSEETMTAEIANHPEHFSPNVVLRPLYQEIILPNLAYLGGPAEVGYWFQLKSVFDLHQVPFPILLPRNFALVVPALVEKRLEKLELSILDLFQEAHVLRAKFIDKHTNNLLDLGDEQERLSTLMSKIAQKAQAIDETLEPAVLAEETRWQKGLERLTKKMRKAEERNQETGLRQLAAVKQDLFPGGHWQERYTNFLEFYLSDPAFLEKLYAAFDPLTFELTVLNH
jgi:bacillithiol biosynthesis cysteine-adding enzyme BshC